MKKNILILISLMIATVHADSPCAHLKKSAIVGYKNQKFCGPKVWGKQKCTTTKVAVYGNVSTPAYKACIAAEKLKTEATAKAAAAKKEVQAKLKAARADLSKSGVAEKAQKQATALAHKIDSATVAQIAAAEKALAPIKKATQRARKSINAAAAKTAERVSKAATHIEQSSRAATDAVRTAGVDRAVQNVEELVAHIHSKLTASQNRKHSKKHSSIINCTFLDWPDQTNLSTLKKAVSHNYKSQSKEVEFCQSKTPKGYNVSYPEKKGEIQEIFRAALDKAQANINTAATKLNTAAFNTDIGQLNTEQSTLNAAYAQIMPEEKSVKKQTATVTAAYNSGGIQNVLAFLREILTSASDKALLKNFGKKALAPAQLTTLTNNTHSKLDYFVSAGEVTQSTANAIAHALPQINSIGSATTQLATAQSQISSAYKELLTSQSRIAAATTQLLLGLPQVDAAWKSLNKAQDSIDADVKAIGQVFGAQLGVKPVDQGTIRATRSLFVPINLIKKAYSNAPEGPYLAATCKKSLNTTVRLPALFGYVDGAKKQLVVLSTCAEDVGNTYTLNLSSCHNKKVSFTPGKGLSCK